MTRSTTSATTRVIMGAIMRVATTRMIMRAIMKAATTRIQL
jgi:hypothetical protein